MRELLYCTKCGTVNPSENYCILCGSNNYQKVPEKYISYLANVIPILNEDLKEEFFETVVKTSPNFDQAAHDRLQEVYANRKRQDEMLKQNTEEQKNVPKCPTCGSTNIRKVSATSKAVSVGLFGIFSQKVKKQFHCGNCGYEW